MTTLEREAMKTAFLAVAKLQKIVQRLVIHQSPSNEEWQDAADTVGTLIALSNQINKDLMKEVNSAN